MKTSGVPRPETVVPKQEFWGSTGEEALLSLPLGLMLLRSTQGGDDIGHTFRAGLGGNMDREDPGRLAVRFWSVSLSRFDSPCPTYLPETSGLGGSSRTGWYLSRDEERDDADLCMRWEGRRVDVFCLADTGGACYILNERYHYRGWGKLKLRSGKSWGWLSIA